jgi:4-carboxymuconolactone decarboxylase
MAQTARGQSGEVIRREVLGDEYVDRAMQARTEFSAPIQDLANEYCWGEIWGRDGLDRRTRSLLNLAMISALNRPHELRVHLAGALRNGVTTDEIREVLLQVAVYCGLPAGIDGFRCAREVFAEQGIEV